MSLVGSGEEEADDVEDAVYIVWFIFLAREKEQALVWIPNEEYVLQTSSIQDVTAARVYEKGADVPLFGLRQISGIIRDSPPDAGDVRICQSCRTCRAAEKQAMCLLCKHGVIVKNASYVVRRMRRLLLDGNSELGETSQDDTIPC